MDDDAAATAAVEKELLTYLAEACDTNPLGVYLDLTNFDTLASSYQSLMMVPRSSAAYHHAYAALVRSIDYGHIMQFLERLPEQGIMPTILQDVLEKTRTLRVLAEEASLCAQETRSHDDLEGDEDIDGEEEAEIVDVVHTGSKSTPMSPLQMCTDNACATQFLYATNVILSSDEEDAGEVAQPLRSRGRRGLSSSEEESDDDDSQLPLEPPASDAEEEEEEEEGAEGAEGAEEGEEEEEDEEYVANEEEDEDDAENEPLAFSVSMLEQEQHDGGFYFGSDDASTLYDELRQLIDSAAILVEEKKKITNFLLYGNEAMKMVMFVYLFHHGSRDLALGRNEKALLTDDEQAFDQDKLRQAHTSNGQGKTRLVNLLKFMRQIQRMTRVNGVAITQMTAVVETLERLPVDHNHNANRMLIWRVLYAVWPYLLQVFPPRYNVDLRDIPNMALLLEQLQIAPEQEEGPPLPLAAAPGVGDNDIIELPAPIWQPAQQAQAPMVPHNLSYLYNQTNAVLEDQTPENADGVVAMAEQDTAYRRVMDRLLDDTLGLDTLGIYKLNTSGTAYVQAGNEFYNHMLDLLMENLIYVLNINLQQGDEGFMLPPRSFLDCIPSRTHSEVGGLVPMQRAWLEGLYRNPQIQTFLEGPKGEHVAAFLGYDQLMGMALVSGISVKEYVKRHWGRLLLGWLRVAGTTWRLDKIPHLQPYKWSMLYHLGAAKGAESPLPWIWDWYDTVTTLHHTARTGNVSSRMVTLYLRPMTVDERPLANKLRGRSIHLPGLAIPNTALPRQAIEITPAGADGPLAAGEDVPAVWYSVIMPEAFDLKRVRENPLLGCYAGLAGFYDLFASDLRAWGLRQGIQDRLSVAQTLLVVLLMRHLVTRKPLHVQDQPLTYEGYRITEAYIKVLTEDFTQEEESELTRLNQIMINEPEGDDDVVQTLVALVAGYVLGDITPDTYRFRLEFNFHIDPHRADLNDRWYLQKDNVYGTVLDIPVGVLRSRYHNIPHAPIDAWQLWRDHRLGSLVAAGSRYATIGFSRIYAMSEHDPTVPPPATLEVMYWRTRQNVLFEDTDVDLMEAIIELRNALIRRKNDHTDKRRGTTIGLPDYESLIHHDPVALVSTWISLLGLRLLQQSLSGHAERHASHELAALQCMLNLGIGELSLVIYRELYQERYWRSTSIGREALRSLYEKMLREYAWFLQRCSLGASTSPTVFSPSSPATVQHNPVVTPYRGPYRSGIKTYGELLVAISAQQEAHPNSIVILLGGGLTLPKSEARFQRRMMAGYTWEDMLDMNDSAPAHAINSPPNQLPHEQESQKQRQMQFEYPVENPDEVAHRSRHLEVDLTPLRERARGIRGLSSDTFQQVHFSIVPVSERLLREYYEKVVYPTLAPASSSSSSYFSQRITYPPNSHFLVVAPGPSRRDLLDLTQSLYPVDSGFQAIVSRILGHFTQDGIPQPMDPVLRQMVAKHQARSGTPGQLQLPWGSHDARGQKRPAEADDAEKIEQEKTSADEEEGDDAGGPEVKRQRLDSVSTEESNSDVDVDMQSEAEKEEYRRDTDV